MKIITVRGNKGKSIFSYFLASEFVKQNKRVIYISADGHNPMYTLLFPTKKEADGQSVGKLLSLPNIDEPEVFKNSQIVNKNFLMLTYCSSDSDRLYPEITISNIATLSEILKKISDFLIVDVSSQNNQADDYFIQHSDYDICITTADSIGYFYRKYYNVQNSHHILFTDSKYNPLPDVISTFEDSPEIMPYFSVFESVYNGYDISDIYLPQKYKKLLQKIVGDING